MGWAVRGGGGDQRVTVGVEAIAGPDDAGPGAPSVDLVRLPPLTGTAPRPVRLTRPMLDRALARGTLAVTAADGSRYSVAIERAQTEPTGDWTVIGRVQTRVGPQAMVLTFGPDAVFGVLPQPDGFLLQVATTRGLTTVAPAGGLLPPGRNMSLAAEPDYVLPHVPSAALVGGQGIAGAAPAAPYESDGTAEVVHEIVVLGLYSEDLAVLRGSASAAETEVTNLFAMANQAHIDSETQLRFRVAGLLQVAVDPGSTNHTALDAITYNRVAGTDVSEARDRLAADLVALVRPYASTHGSCGVAWLNGADQSRHLMMDHYGYSVTNVAPCGPHVLAHELGHNLGSSHDRETSTQNGVVRYGAYPFSFGYRQDGPPAFATIMAYTSGQPWVGYFSSPRSQRCAAACGTSEDADNVRSQSLMAPMVAAFRGPPGTLSIVAGQALEPPTGQVAELVFQVRLSGVAPTGGVTFDIELAGGTATPDSDFIMSAAAARRLTIPEGQREHRFTVLLSGDEVEEPDETVVLRLINVSGAPVHTAEAAGVIIDDDPRSMVTGRLQFPVGETRPTSSSQIWVYGADGGGSVASILVDPPDFRFAIAVARRANLRFSVRGPPPFVMMPFDVQDVRKSYVQVIHMTRGVNVSGEVRLPPGDRPLTASTGMYLSASLEGVFQEVDSPWLSPPYFRYNVWVMPGSWVYMRFDPPVPYAPFEAIHTRVIRDLVQNLDLSTLPALVIWASPVVPEGPGGTHGSGSVVVQLSAPAPAGGVRLRYRTVDGTATAGSDYIATSGTLEFLEGERSKFISLTWFGDDELEGDEYFHVELSDVVGANPVVTRLTRTLKETDRIMSTPLPPEVASR